MYTNYVEQIAVNHIVFNRFKKKDLQVYLTWVCDEPRVVVHPKDVAHRSDYAAMDSSNDAAVPLIATT